MARVLILIMDGAGIGEMPDAGEYGDEGSNTLKNLANAVGGLSLPCLESLGLGNLGDFKGIGKTRNPLSSFGVMSELSKGKDSVTGHWEMMGIVNEHPFPTYPNGFPPEIIREFEARTGRKTLGNKAASGTKIIEELGDEHVKTGSPIVYTSADSVFQIACHEDVIGVEALYEMCLKAREMLVPPHDVCRVIARPFTGPPYRRTANRRDFSLPPPEETVLDRISEKGIKVVAVGKVIDLFSGKGFSNSMKVKSNADAMDKITVLLPSFEAGIIFSTFTDFDTLYGHRNNPEGFASALREFDKWLSALIPELKEDDYLFITADHGNDPTTPSTDHSREYVPVLFYNRAVTPKDLGMREGFCDLAATVAEIFGIGFKRGKSFLGS
ncbi:MAG: phosphopentomutase [Thermodesulfovibrionales bacterium]|nr:phosphopentomutase [Thermodesulfovibrionales bacterium]